MLDARLRHDLRPPGQGGRRVDRRQIIGPPAWRRNPAGALRLLWCRRRPVCDRRAHGGVGDAVLRAARRRGHPARLASGADRLSGPGRLPGDVQVEPPVRLDPAGRLRRRPHRPVSETDIGAFITAQTRISAAALIPELRLHLASQVTPLSHATEATLERHNLPPPYWAFAWPGSQALALHVLDHPDLVRGRRGPHFAAGRGGGRPSRAPLRGPLAPA